MPPRSREDVLLQLPHPLLQACDARKDPRRHAPFRPSHDLPLPRARHKAPHHGHAGKETHEEGRRGQVAIKADRAQHARRTAKRNVQAARLVSNLCQCRSQKYPTHVSIRCSRHGRVKHQQAPFTPIPLARGNRPERRLRQSRSSSLRSPHQWRPSQQFGQRTAHRGHDQYLESHWLY